jgi:hypothetical protein
MKIDSAAVPSVTSISIAVGSAGKHSANQLETMPPILGSSGPVQGGTDLRALKERDAEKRHAGRRMEWKKLA